MKKKMTFISSLVLVLLIAGVGFLLSRQREVVGVDQIGVVVSPGGRIAVYQAGDRPMVLPLIQRYVRLTAKPVRYELTDAKGITVTDAKHQAITIGCQVRYQVNDAAKLVATQGTESPQTAIESLIHQLLTAQMTAALHTENASLDDVQTRVLLVGSIHQALRQSLGPMGIEVISFDLFSW
jgi:regulator of protease activity HflC (stomatin/prohibitin superfamily)